MNYVVVMFDFIVVVVPDLFWKSLDALHRHLKYNLHYARLEMATINYQLTIAMPGNQNWEMESALLNFRLPRESRTKPDKPPPFIHVAACSIPFIGHVNAKCSRAIDLLILLNCMVSVRLDSMID